MTSFPSRSSFALDFKYSSAETWICKLKKLQELSPSAWDFDVYLPSRGISLQRPLCWTHFQAEQLIWSLLRERQIPPVAINFCCESGVRQVIDGKQRINVISDFLRNRTPITWKGQHYYRRDLPREYDHILANRPLLGHIAYDLTEQQKIDWFLQINFMGTPQDEAHCKNLESFEVEGDG